MNNKEILVRLQEGLGHVFEKDSILFDLGSNGVSEQSITFRLGLYLQCLFRELHVDCEYNRCGTDLKTDEQVDLEWMKPDIIVHERKEKDANLIVIEAKKSGTWAGGWHDVNQKLRAFTRSNGKYEYRLGVAWRIAPSQNPKKHCLVWFWKGNELYRTPVLGFLDEIMAKIDNFEEMNNE